MRLLRESILRDVVEAHSLVRLGRRGSVIGNHSKEEGKEEEGKEKEEEEGKEEEEEGKEVGNNFCSDIPLFCEEFTLISRFLFVGERCDVLPLPDAFGVSFLSATFE